MQPAPHFPAAVSPEVIDPRRLVAIAELATVEHHLEVESTMHRARVLAAQPSAALPAVVLADRQTGGRGRRAAGWWQSDASLAMTVVVDPAWLGWPAPSQRPPAAAGWSLACGIALAESLMRLEPDLTIGLRWPNDLEVAGRKIAGILAETSPSGRVLFGVGVNTAGRCADAPLPLRERLVTIPDLVGKALPRQLLLEAFLPQLWKILRLLAAEPAVLRRRYAPLCTLTGKQLTFYHGEEQLRGICQGIDASGALCMQTAEGERRFHGGSLTPESSQWRPESFTSS